MNIIEQIKVNDVSIDGYQGTYYSESPEYVQVTTDSEGKVLEGIKIDGSKHIAGNLIVDGSIYSDSFNVEQIVEDIQERVEEVLEPVEETLSYFDSIENLEWLSVDTDVDGRVLGGRDKKGRIKEYVSLEAPQISANTIKTGVLEVDKEIMLSNKARTSFQDDVVNDLITGQINIESIARLGYNIQSQDTPPENSIQGFQEAYKHHYRSMLADVRWTSDGVPVALHDETINAVARNADGSVIVGDVKLDSLTLAQVDEYDFGIIKGEKYAGLKIMRLDEFLKWAKFMNIKPYLEIKDFENSGVSGNLTAAKWQTITDPINKYGLQNKVTFLLDQGYGSNLDAATLVHQTYPDSDMCAHRITGNWETDCERWATLIGAKNEIFWYFYKEYDMTNIIPNEAIVASNRYGIGIGHTEIRTEDEVKQWFTDTNNLVCTRVAIRNKPINEYIVDGTIKL